MINGILWVLGCQLVGEVLVRALGISIPGPVVGMVLLFGVLSCLRPGRPQAPCASPTGCCATSSSSSSR